MSGVRSSGNTTLPPSVPLVSDLDRRDALGVPADIAHRVLASFVRQQLDLAREVTTSSASAIVLFPVPLSP